jgi:hypothetical protein
MDINNTGKIYGIPEGITYRQFERTDELNDRIVMRNIPDIYLRPNIDSHQAGAIPPYKLPNPV